MVDAKTEAQQLLDECSDVQECIRIDWKRVGAALRKRREDSGLSLRAVARQAGFSPSHITNCEDANHEGRQENVERILAAIRTLCLSKS